MLYKDLQDYFNPKTSVPPVGGTSPPPPAPAPLAPPGAQGGGWQGSNTSDPYGAALSDPLYLQGQADFRASQQASDAARREAIRRYYIEGGFDLQNFNDPYGDINQETKLLGKKNTEAGLSTYARIQKAYVDAIRKMKQNLAARGMLQSGELGFGVQQNELTDRQNLADATSKLMDSFAAARNQYISQQMAAQQNLQGILAQIYQQNRQQQPYYSGGGSSGPSLAPQEGFGLEARSLPGFTGNYFAGSKVAPPAQITPNGPPPTDRPSAQTSRYWNGQNWRWDGQRWYPY